LFSSNSAANEWCARARPAVAVEVRQARDGSSNANAQTVTLSSTGQRLFAGSPVQPAQ